MREHGIAGYKQRRKHGTTLPEPADEKYPDLLKRDFTAPAPNLRDVGDITYLPIADGSKLYLATVIDCCSHKLVGWAIADHMRVELVENTLKAAHAERAAHGGLAGAIFHSDHGSVGGFNRLSQHVVIRGVLSGSSAAGSRPRDPSEVEVAGASKVPTRVRGGVLRRDREGFIARGGCPGRRCVTVCRRPVVPPRWRHAAVRSHTAHGAVPVIC